MNRAKNYVSLRGRRTVVVPMFVALIIVATHVVLNVLNSVVFAGLLSSQNTDQDIFPYLPFVSLFGVQILGFAVGVFLCVWLLVPIAAELRLVQVVIRSLLATLSGGVAWFLVQLILSLTENFDRSAAMAFGWVSGLGSTLSSSADWIFANLTFSSLTLALDLLPLTLLAGVLVWAWLREHPVARAAVKPDDKV